MGIKGFVQESVAHLLGRPLPESRTARHFFERVSAEAEAELDATRAAARLRLAQLVTQLDAVTLAHVDVRAEAETVIARRLADVETAREAYRTVLAEHQLAIAPIESAIAVQRRILAELPSAVLEAFIVELRTLVDQATGEYETVTEPRMDGSRPVIWTNRGSVDARVCAIRAAMTEVAALTCAGLPDVEAAAQCEAIREALPAIEPMPRKYWAAAREVILPVF